MELIDRRKLVSDFWKGVEDGSILSYEDTDNLMENAPTVDDAKVCIQEVIRYIDLTFERQRYDSIWLDEKMERHSADVGYGYEWWKECMKPELLRMFSNVGTKMDGYGNA